MRTIHPIADEPVLRKAHRAIADAAQDKRFICYGDLSGTNSADWQKLRGVMIGNREVRDSSVQGLTGQGQALFLRQAQ